MNLARKGLTTVKRPRWLALCGLFVAACTTTSCIELGIVAPIGNGNGSLNGDGGSAPDPQDPKTPVTSLAVSNPTPQLNEQVRLTCHITSGAVTGATFTFTASPQPGAGLSVSRSTGVATFIVTESDINISFRFSCSAVTDSGASAPSAARVVTPTSL